MSKELKDFNWSSKDIWKRSAKNTAWCVLGCAIIDERRLILAPDCGLGFLPRELCFQKLKIITKVAKSFIN